MTLPQTPAQSGPMADDAPHLLVVDDDSRIRDLLAGFLKANGFRVSTAADASAARAAMAGMAFDGLILDVMMPGESGLEFASSLRDRSDVPILMLTALSGTEDRIRGLETGVDDYLDKPFEPRELLLRVNNLLRRRRGPTGAVGEITLGRVVFHIGRGELRQGDEIIKLTERERELMRLFAQAVGKPIPRHELDGSGGAATERAIDVQINRLRRKIEPDPANPTYLQTVRGVGYILYAD